MVATSQKKRRISKKERDELEQNEQEIKKRLQWKEIEPPSYLNRKQKNMFRKYVEQLRELEAISALDADILAHYVTFQSIYQDLKTEVEKDGYILSGKVNPALAEMRQISKTVYTYQNKLGLNPSDRLRFRSNDVEEVDELAEFQDEL